MSAGKTTQPIHNREDMGNWAPFYDWMVKILTLGTEKKMRETTVDLVPIKAGDNVLDVGCGTGTLTLVAKERAGFSAEVCGIDAAPEMIAIARRKAARAGKDVRFDVGVIDDLPYPDGKFTAALCSFMIHHLPAETRRKGVSEILRVLKHGGRLLILDLRPPERCSDLLALLEGGGFQHVTVQTKKIARVSPRFSVIRATVNKAA